MKKFLSYILTFISLFVISTVVTIQSQSDLLKNQSSSSAGASSPTTLLAGIMESIENNPKLDINGDISISYDDLQIGVSIDADIDLTTLTNPSIMASVGLSLYGNTYQILLTYAKDEIFLSCQNMSIQSKISEITDVVGLISSLIGQPVAMPSMDLSAISLDSIMEALNNPQKVEVENTTLYTITLPNIAKVTIACDDKFNIQGISIDEFFMIEDCDIGCDIKVSQDANIDIVAPENSGEYLDIASLINGLISYKDKNLKVSANTNIYKNNLIFERIDTMGFAQISQNKYQLNNKIDGALDGQLNINYLDDVLYAKFNDIGVSLTSENIQYIQTLLDNSQASEVISETANVIDELISWLLENYNDILQNATIASNQILVVLPMNGKFGQSQDINVVLKLNNSQIEAISLSGISVGEYSVYTTIYIREFKDYELSTNSQEYLQMSTIMDIVDWIKDVKTLEVDGNLQATINGQITNLDFTAKVDTQNNNQQIATSLFDMPISITHLGEDLYIGVNDIFIKLDAQSLVGVISQYVPQQEIDNMLEKITRIAKNLTVNDVLSIVKISTTTNSIRLEADLSQFLGKTLKIDVSLAFDKGFVLSINNLEYNDIALTGSATIINSDNLVEVQQADKYVSVENVIDYIDEFVSSQNYTISGEIDFSGFGVEQSFNGLIKVDLENLNLQVSGALNGKIKADVDLLYTDHIFYITYNNQKFVLSEEKLIQLLNEFNIDICPVMDKINKLIQTKNDLSLKSYLYSLSMGSQPTEMTAKTGDLMQTLAISDIIEIIKNTTIANSAISTNFSIGGYDIQAEIQLNESMEIGLILDGEISVNTNLSISTDETNYSTNGEYINLDLVTPKIIAIKNTLAHKNFNGKININAGSNLETFVVDYKLSIDDGISINLSTNIKGLNIEIIFVDNELYAKVDNICFNISLEQLTAIVTNLFGEQIEEVVAQVKDSLDMSVDELLEMVYTITTGDAIISDVHTSGITTYITLLDKLQLIMSGVDNLMYLGVSYDDFKISATISYDDSQQINKPQGYLNVIDFVETLNGWVNSSTYAISGELDFSGFGIDEKFVGDIAIDFANLALTIDGKLSGKLNADISLTYANERFYVSYNKQHFTISEAELVNLLNEFGIDISNILAQVKEIAEVKNNFNLIDLVNSLLGISTLDEETGANIDVDQVVEIVKNIIVSSSNIGIDYNFGTFAIDANIALGENLDITLALALQDIAVNADITLSKTYNFKELDNNNYINLDYVVPRVPQILELIENNNFAGDITLSDGEQSLVVAYALYLDIEAKQIELTLATTVKGLDLEIYISNDEIYLKVENIYLNISVEQLFTIAQNLFGNVIDEIIAQLEESKNISVDDILAKVEEVTSSNELVTKLTDIDNTTYLTILDKLTISLAQTDKTIVGLSYNDISLDLSISATNGDSIVTKPTAETYLNIVDFVDTLKGWVNSSTYAISGELDFSGFGIDEKFVGDIAIDFANLALTIDGRLSGKLNADIELTYANERFYVSYNKQHFTISETELVKLLNEFGIDISNILAQIKEIANIKNNFTLTNLVNSLLGISTLDEETGASIDVDQIIEIISKININSQEIAFNGDILGYSIDLSIAFGAKIDVKLAISNENMAISANAGIDQQVEQDKFEVSNNYFSLDNSSVFANGIVNMLNDNQFAGTISIRFGDSELEDITATYDINIVDGKINAEFAITYLGQTVTIYVIDNQLFINVKGIFVKATIEQVIEILQAELPEDIKQKIDDTKEQLFQSSSDIFKTIEDITNSQFIDKLEITQNKLVIEILGISAEVGVANGKLSNVKVLYNDIDVNLTISSSENGNIISVDESTYIDIDNVYNLVKNVYNYIMSGEYNFNISLSAFGCTVSGYVGYNQEISAHLQTTILNKTLSVDIIAETLYVNFDGFVAHIAFAHIPALISELNAQFELGISQDILDIVDKLLVSKDINIDDLTKLTNGQESVEWSQVLEKIIINLTEQTLFVGYDKINAQINLANNMITSASVGALIDSQNISATISLCDKQTLTTPSAGLDVSGITDLLQYISKLVKTTNYAGTFSFDYKEDISLDGNYQLLIKDAKLFASISTTFYDLPISLTVIDDVVYAQIDNVKIYLPLAQINNLISWINTSFNQSLPTDLDISTDLNNTTGSLSLDGITLGDVVVSLLNNILSVKYQDAKVVATIRDISSVALTYQDISATITIDTTTEQIVAPQGYLPYTDLTNLVDSLLDLYNTGKISATVSASVYEGADLHYSADCALQIDIKEKLIFISVEVKDLFKDSTTALMVAFRDNYWFVDYNNLKLKINKTDLNEILAILLEVVGIDPSLLPFLSDVVGGLDVNTDSLNAIVPELDFGNPLTLLDVFEKISLKQGELSVEVDNSLIAGDLNSENISAILKTQNNKLSYILLNNLYTGITDYETLDLILNMQEFTSVSEPYQGNYIDISGANELIKAIINTAELDYFEITATIDVDMKVIGIPIPMSVPMDIRVRLDENRKPEMMISLGDIPVLKILGFNINNDIGVSIEKRMWYIYYKDSYIYMLRHDEASKKVYQKEIKVHADSFFDDFFYYLQWGVGFSDSIMNEIEKALALTDGYTPDLGKVINGFTVTDSQNFSIDVNMGEVANNPQIDNMIVDLGVVNNEETNNKNYIGIAEFYLNMPVATVCTIKLVSEDMKLINIGKSFDFSDFEKFVYNYVGSEGTEYSREWSTSNGTAWDYDGAEWKLASEREYTITFDSKGGEAVDSITGKTNQEITLPALSNKVVVDTDAGIRYTYKFAGWYETENNQNGTEFTSTTMPKKNVTLYAKWVVISTEQVVTITFDSTGGTAVDSISGYAGSQVDISDRVPTKATTYEKVKYVATKGYLYNVYDYSFDGWYIDSDCTTKFDGILPDTNTTLYAKWNVTKTQKYYHSWALPD